MKLLVICLLISACVPRSKANDEGAPEEDCISMDPSGHGTVPQTKPPPFETVPLQAKIEKGGQVEISLLALNSTTFKGFLTMAFDASYPETPIGTFEVIDSSEIKTLNCSGFNTAITQTSDSYKVNVTAIWRAPELFFGTVMFKTTFVQKKTSYWVAVPSVANVTIPYCETYPESGASDIILSFALKWFAAFLLPVLSVKFSF